MSIRMPNWVKMLTCKPGFGIRDSGLEVLSSFLGEVGFLKLHQSDFFGLMHLNAEFKKTIAAVIAYLSSPVS